MHVCHPSLLAGRPVWFSLEPKPTLSNATQFFHTVIRTLLFALLQETPANNHRGMGNNRKKKERALHAFVKAAKISGDLALCVSWFFLFVPASFTVVRLTFSQRLTYAVYARRTSIGNARFCSFQIESSISGGHWPLHHRCQIQTTLNCFVLIIPISEWGFSTSRLTLLLVVERSVHTNFLTFVFQKTCLFCRLYVTVIPSHLHLLKNYFCSSTKDSMQDMKCFLQLNWVCYTATGALLLLMIFKTRCTTQNLV